MACSVISTLVPMQNVEGGFGGGHGQLSHCASSYAAVLSLVMVGGEEALNVIDRKMLLVRASQPSTRHC
jgi:protein farnesyltransferase subunit beta